MSKKEKAQKYSYQYNIRYEEAYETYYLLYSRFNKNTLIVIGAILMGIAVSFLVLYALNNEAVHYMFIAVIAIFLLFYELYAPVLTSKRSAQKTVNQKGLYRVTISDTGFLYLRGEDALPLKNDKHARIFETEKSFILRPDSTHTLCIPKRVIPSSDQEVLRKIFSTSGCHFIQKNTSKTEKN